MHRGVVVVSLLAAVLGSMDLRLREYKQNPAEFQPLEADSNSDTDAMRMSSVPDADINPDQSQMMTAANEDGLDVGGDGKQMQLSGSSLKSLGAACKDDADGDDEGEIAVSNDMSKDANAVGAVFDAKNSQLSQARQELEASRSNLDQQVREAKRLIKEAYSKQAYLTNMQKQVLEQSVAVEQEKNHLKDRETEVESLRQELEALKAQLSRNQPDTSVAIQTQLGELDAKKREVEASHAATLNEMTKTRESLEKMKAELDVKNQDLDKKESEMKKLFVELSEMKRSSEKHEQALHDEEERVKREEEELKARETDLAERQKTLADKDAQITAKAMALKQPHVHSRADIERMVDPQLAIQTSVELKKDLSELPADAAAELAVPQDLSPETVILQQPLNYTKSKPQIIVSAPATPEINITIEDRTTRNVETRLDLRPDTYGQKLLTGQAYSAAYNPSPDNDPRDPDGLCRNSRGVVIPCSFYAGPSTGPAVPPIVQNEAVNEFDEGWHGPCVLKCAYHKGQTSSVGQKNIQEIAIEINTDLRNNTFACPRANNGYPFLSCSLLINDSDRCRSSCVFDGDANPLKPRMLGIGFPTSGLQQFSMNATEFKTLAYTTYTLVTNTGCKSSMRADPLVACEVRL